MFFDNSMFPRGGSNIFEEAQEKLQIELKKFGELVQETIVHTIGQVSPEAAETVDQTINNVCNFAETVGNVLRQQEKYSPPTRTPVPHPPLALVQDDSELVTVQDCCLADHLFRDGGGIGALIYSHHAIYVGQGHVIHYAHDSCNNICIHETTFEDFAEGYPVYRMSRAASPLRYSPEEAVRRARSRKWESEYNLLFNNCENFVR